VNTSIGHIKNASARRLVLIITMPIVLPIMIVGVALEAVLECTPQMIRAVRDCWNGN
jgi:hypothetical protein